jgi:hypothetical protein
MASWKKVTDTGSGARELLINLDNIAAMKRYDGYTVLEVVGGRVNNGATLLIQVKETPEQILTAPQVRSV